MNLLLLPIELQILISEFNVEHRSKMRVVLNELIKKPLFKELVVYHKIRLNRNNYCSYCRGKPDENLTKFIKWKKLKFCSEWCRFNEEYDIRYNYYCS